MSPTTISAAAAPENEPGISTALSIVGWLSIAAAALSLVMAAALSLLIWGASSLTAADGGSAEALGLAAAGIVSGVVFLGARKTD